MTPQLFPSLAALGPAGAGAGPLQLLLQGVAGDVAKAVDKELEVSAGETGSDWEESAGELGRSGRE